MKTEHVYTASGHQRAIYGIAKYGESIAFTIELHAPQTGLPDVYLEMTDDADEVVRAGKADWFPVAGHTGILTGATAIRLVNGNSGWTKLYVNGVEGPDAGCVGELTRINSRLASMNRDMRVCAALV